MSLRLKEYVSIREDCYFISLSRKLLSSGCMHTEVVHDKDSLGLGYFSDPGLTIHSIANTEWDRQWSCWPKYDNASKKFVTGSYTELGILSTAIRHMVVTPTAASNYTNSSVDGWLDVINNACYWRKASSGPSSNAIFAGYRILRYTRRYSFRLFMVRYLL